MDLYYQDFKTDEDFFDLQHFMYLVSLAYSKFLQDYYEKMYARALAETGHGLVEFDPSWFVQETLPLKRSRDEETYEAELKQKPFYFLGDLQDRSIQYIQPVKSDVRLYRISATEVYKLRNLPFTRNVFYYRPGGRKFIFSKVKGGLEEVLVSYMPSLSSLDPELEMADALGAPIVQNTLELMASLRNGTVIDMTNNQNPNKQVETEIDQAFRTIKNNQ